MKNALRKMFYRSTLTTKIRYSYLLLVIPMFLFLVFCFYNLWESNQTYEGMLNSAVAASDFSLDFKNDFDYETYLLIVENKTIEESNLDEMLTEANGIVSGLEQITDSPENVARLERAKKYLNNLEIYTNRIKENLLEGNKYEDNIDIWENDVLIVTALLRDTISEYIYYEIKDIQQARSSYQEFYLNLLGFSLIAFVVIVILIIALSYYIPQSITRPIRELRKVTDQVAKGDLSVRAHITTGSDVSELGDSLNTMIEKINALLNQVTKEQLHLRNAEFELLQSQINPHFLYNTLDTIVWLAEAGNQKEVVRMVGSLSDFFRTSLNQGQDIISVRDELLHVKSYLTIQQVRYQDILSYEIEVPKNLNDERIPKITIQPIVENALYHGIKNKRGMGKILISGNLYDDHYTICVEDNGIGMEETRLHQIQEMLEKSGGANDDSYGLYNVNERIRLKFGKEYGIRIASTYQKGTQVWITLPCQKNQPNS